MKITKDMGIAEIVEAYPNAVGVLRGVGMGCIGCIAARFETLEAGAQAHGIDVDKLIEVLNGPEVVGAD